MMFETKRYLGDGVYAIWAGFGIWLYANDVNNPTDKIFLEPEVYQSLLKYVDDIREHNKSISQIN